MPFQAACEMPLDMALALLSPEDERQQNTRQSEPQKLSSTPPAKRPGTTYIATRFKNAGKNKP
ncbi:hypothetical protein WCE14_00620 [Acinetobacter schindleri]|uniref:hypothetical protein n=1 Tax=Acinetobacter schindleri TaxID=108981 RepID=UPI0034D4A6C4